MVDMPLMAATAWAQAHAAESKDPVAFGAKVARVYLAAESTKYHGCKDTSSELEATILREAGFGDPMPPKNGGDANAEGATQPHKPTPPSPIDRVAALYEGAANAMREAPALPLGGLAPQSSQSPASPGLPFLGSSAFQAEQASSQACAPGTSAQVPCSGACEKGREP